MIFSKQLQCSGLKLGIKRAARKCQKSTKKASNLGFESHSKSNQSTYIQDLSIQPYSFESNHSNLKVCAF